MLGGEEFHALKHGYYSVRLADDDQRNAGVSRDDIHKVEERFFTATAPWSRMSGKERKRLGVSNLTESLSKLLIEMIESR
jgi:vacuolar protein sorting-associated protein 1